MKRTSREWLYSLHWGLSDKHAQDILDSDARQRAVIADLKARLRSIDKELAWPEAWAKFDLKNKKWRGP